MIRFSVDAVFGSPLFAVVILFPLVVFISNLIW